MFPGLRGAWKAVPRARPAAGCCRTTSGRAGTRRFSSSSAYVAGFTIFAFASGQYAPGHSVLHGASLLGFAVLGSIKASKKVAFRAAKDLKEAV